MAKIAFALNQSLEGFVDHMAFQPAPVLFSHFIEDVRGLTGFTFRFEANSVIVK
ncbi:hypothetical protein LBW89_25535 [Paenibacillus sp. alder61]|uniref:hypothetical protein n=1 Tax=Paenibacillus sp. alder61 TaxID=2862948 RepID=UPI001CD39175|nr:hypothetical protein [Paenibacillus sp. alder61]MCA1296377.1 hypothetical protein [Paenibacillus sp. alder61]